MTVLLWLGIAVGCLLALLLLLVMALLLVPVAIDAAWGEERRDVAVAGPGVRIAYDVPTRTTELWLFSRRLGRWTSSERGRKRDRARRPRRRGARRGFSPRRLWAERGRLLSALRAFFRRLRFQRLALDATLASPDPALTGWLTGAAYAVRGVAPARVRAAVTFRPDFEVEGPSLALDASLRLRPVHAAVLALRLWRVTRAARTGVARKDAARKDAARKVGAEGTGDERGRDDGSGRRDAGNDRRNGGGREQP